MGKSSKKSATKVETAPAVVAPNKPLKKGKREAEEIIEKPRAAKKQKSDIKEAAAKKIPEVKTIKKKVETSSSDDSSSESEPELKKDVVKKVPVATAKNGAVKKVKSSSSESDSSDESDSDDEVPTSKVASIKNGPAAGSKKHDLSDDSDSESSDEDVPAPKKNPAAATKVAVAAPKKDDSSDESDSEDSSEDDAPAPSKKSVAPVKAAKKDGSSDESDSEDSSDDDTPAAKKPVVATVKAAKKDDSSESDSEESSSDDDEAPAAKVSAVTPKSTSAVPKKKDETSSDSESDDSDSSDDDVPAPATKKAPVAVAKKEESSDSEDGSSEESSDEEEQPKQKKAKAQQADVDMVDAEPTPKKEPKTPVTPKVQPSEGSKTLFVGNLPFTVERADIENFFKEVGEVVDVRFALHPEGGMKGYGHVEFASAADAKKVLENMNGQELFGRALRLDLAAERGAYTPQSGGFERNSFQRAERVEGTSIFIRGLDTNDDEYKTKDALREHFGSCGEISRISVPKDPEGYIKGIAFMDFKDKNGFNKALELDQSEFGQTVLGVSEAKPREDNNGGSGRGGRSGGRDSGGRGRGGRDGGGRFGGRGRGGRTPSRPSMATPGTGKKTTFDD